MSRTIREELKRAFEKSGLTYEEFGNRVGICKSSAFKKLNGDAPIDTNSELPLFARVLGVQVVVSGAA